MTQTIIEWVKASGVIIAAVSLYLSYRQLRSNIRWNRINATYTYLPETVFVEREPAAATALQAVGIDLYKQQEPVTTQIVTAIIDDSNAFKEVKDFLNMFEDYATAYKAQAIDQNHAYQLSASRFILYYRVFQPFIEELRAKRRNPKIWLQFDLLVTEDWYPRQKEEIRKLKNQQHPFAKYP
jgi:hypothetical protein